MPYRWPEGTVFRRLELEVEDRTCQVCHDWMYVCDHRHHRIFTLGGPVHLVSKLVHCPDPTCPGHPKTFSPEAETAISLPWWVIGWDVFCWIGQRRFARHWSVSEIRAELEDSYQIGLSSDAVERYVRRYQQMLAARQQDPQGLADEYRQVESLVLCIDGLQPEKGHETLYVVRELSRKRVWFAESLISSTAAEVRRLLAQAREWAARLGKPVRGWMSDKQDAFLSGIAAEFPGVPHRYCSNHFLRDLAKPVLELDSHAKVKMRTKVRGLRAIEREVLQARRPQAATSPPVLEQAGASAAPRPVESLAVAEPRLVLAEEAPSPTVSPAVPAAPVLERAARPPDTAPEPPDAGEVVLDYCTAVRGILNDDQGGPLHPCGVRMAAALGEVRQSLERSLAAKKGGAHTNNYDG